MPSPYWGWGLTGVTCLGLWLAGTPRWRRLGWGLALANEVLWSAYALLADQPGLLVGAALFAGVYGRNLWRARAGGA